MKSDDQPRSDLTATELDEAVQLNLFDLFRDMSRLPGGEIEEQDAFSRHHASPTNPMFKGIWNCHGTGEEFDAVVAGSLEWMQARQAPFVFAWLAPGTEPDGARELLRRRGFEAWELDAPSMVGELETLDWEVLARVPATFRIERVRTEELLEGWAHGFVTGYDLPAWAAQAWVDATRAFGFGSTPWELYVGLLDGEPVATSMLVLGGGVAGILAVATVPAARRKGIGAAITLAGYRDAQERGYRYGVLFSSQEGLPVYRRIGLRETGTGISRFLWRAA